jgi:exopolyphosphatase/guanosine-5'-triphosphate,3'-diphosphate pyrophosphatase
LAKTRKSTRPKAKRAGKPPNQRRAIVGTGLAPPAALAKSTARRGTPHGLRIAAIDIGTNSLHLVVVEVTNHLSFKIIGAEKDYTQLGASAMVQHRLTARAMNHTLEALRRYQQVITRLDCDVTLAYATSAVRESVNGGEFVQLAKEMLGLHIQVISAEQEAYLIYVAVRQTIDLSNGPTLVVDIGGGSTEFILADAHKALLLESRKIGASRLTHQFVHTDPISKKEFRALREHIREQTDPLLEQTIKLGVKNIIGTSGTMQNVAQMCAGQRAGDLEQAAAAQTIDAKQFNQLFDRLVGSDLRERRDMPGLDPHRAPQIVAGASVIREIFSETGLPTIQICDRALREGMIIDYMQTHWPKVRLSVQIRDPRRRSVVELMRRCNADEKHAGQVAKLSLLLFDQLRNLHKLGDAERELLEYAALMHDIGWHIGHSGHHKHSYYLIKNGDLENFSAAELELIANVARYHRKSMPKKSHPAWMSLDKADQVRVAKLAGLLRIADGLDRGHYGNVTELKCSLRSRGVTIAIRTAADPELELWAAHQKTDLFETAFRRAVTLRAQIAVPPRAGRGRSRPRK